MEEKKEKKCCENGACENCKDKKGCCCCCCFRGWYTKSPKQTKVLFWVIIIAVICVGASLLCGDGFREHRRNERFFDRTAEIGKNLGNSGSGSITVKVLPPETPASGTTTPPVTQ